ncbi:MAG: TetR/AcrR family transcriptional regulator [Caulobacter sp.]|nr:TetR/AcrR family transcriptional regulator [Caulobacter sp.]
MPLDQQTAAAEDQRLLESARLAFARDGFAAADLGAIAKAAGLSSKDLSARYPDKKALFTAVVVALETAFDAHCRQASSGLLGEPMDLFLAGCRAALEFGGRRDFARIVMIEGPGVLGVEEWERIDHGLGLPTLRQGLRNLAPQAGEAALRPMAVMVMGALNELILALAREEKGVAVEDSLSLLERLLRAWAGR